MALLEFDEPLNRAVIKVVGVGGGGGNAINTMINGKVDGVEFVAANTDMQALEANLAAVKLQLGAGVTRGLGAGANPEVGRKSALEDKDRIAEVLSGADMVFVTCGMGGGTGTGAAPVIAEVSREVGALTVGVVTKPFLFEGRRRRRQAEEGVQSLAEVVDTLITIPNDRLLQVAGQKMSMVDAFRRVDDVLLNAVAGITDLIAVPGLVNVDFADVKTIMSNTGRALMGTGHSSDDNRAVEAARQAIASPLLEDISIEGATGILINITGGPDLTLHEVNEAATMIEEAAHDDANIIFGSVIDPNMSDEVRITVIATGFDRRQGRSRADATKSPATRRPEQTQMALGYDGDAGDPPPHDPVLRQRAGSPADRQDLADPLPAPPAPRSEPLWSGDDEWSAPTRPRLDSSLVAAALAATPEPAGPPPPMPFESLGDAAPVVTLSLDNSSDVALDAAVDAAVAAAERESADDETDPGRFPIAPIPARPVRPERSGPVRPERSGPVIARLQPGNLSAQEEAEIDIPTFLRRQQIPTD